MRKFYELAALETLAAAAAVDGAAASAEELGGLRHVSR